MEFRKSAILLLIPLLVLCQDLISQELLFVPWGENDNEIGLRKAPDGQFGPMSFIVKDNKIFILDTQNKKLKVFRDSKLIDTYNLPSSHIDDFAWFSENNYYLLEHNRVYSYINKDIKNKFETESPRNLITELEIVNNKFQVILNESISKQPGEDKTIAYSKNAGIEDANGNTITIEKHSTNRITIKTRRNSGGDESFDISSANNDLGLARHLGTTPSGDLYIYLEKITQHIPLELNRYIYLYSSAGHIKKIIDVPLHMHTYIFSEFYIDKNGDLFHMITSKEGVYILALHLSSEKKSIDILSEYPTKLLKLHHYNTIEAEFPETSDISLDTQANLKAEDISRDESLNIGDTYVQHQWVAEAGNITNGRITDPNGVEIETPPWVEIGQNTKVPYKWGGFQTLTEFDNGLLSGKFAGDKATTGSSSYCVGVDCSGFVSRCWRLPYHYSTRMMDDNITVAYDSWNELKPADAIHKVGHVRLFVEENPNGSLLTVEAAGADWRVSYRSFSLSQLYDYTPRYYINMPGTPTVIPAAELNSVTFSDSVRMHWSCDKKDDIAGFNLYVNETGTDWDNVSGGDLVPATNKSASFQRIQGAPIFYKITCTSATDDLLEGNPSDIYGYYNSGGATKVLIVDGFDRIDGSYNSGYHEFARSLGASLAYSQISFESASNNAVIDGSIDLDNYDGVFWILGDESTSDETFNFLEQQLVEDYLLQGGKVFISGSELAWDLDNKGSSSDRTFFNDVLKTKYDQDDSQSYTVTGANGTVFEGLTIHFDDGTHGVYEEDYPDSYHTNGGSFEALKYNNGLIAATAFEGNLNGGSAPAKILVMGFPFETIYNETERNSLMVKLLKFFKLTTTSIGKSRMSLPEQPVLFKNYPNPFNLNTTIRLDIPGSQFVSLDIYNLYGQKITTLVSRKLTQGKYQYKWDAAGYPDGIYYCVLKTSNGFEQTKKMVLMH